MIELRIGKKCEAKLPPCNVYEVIVEVMHGDGDKYENIKFRGGHDEVMPKLKLLAAFFQLDWNSRCDILSVKNAILNAASADGSDPTQAWDWYTDHIGWDCTNDGNSLAMPQSINVFWYDESRQKFEVDLVGLKSAS
jgi:hypothetical protein